MKSSTITKLRKKEPDYESIRNFKSFENKNHQHPRFSSLSNPSSSTISTPQLTPPNKEYGHSQKANYVILERSVSTDSNYSFAKSDKPFHLSDINNRRDDSDDAATLSHDQVISMVQSPKSNEQKHNHVIYEKTINRTKMTNLNSLNFTDLSVNLRRSTSLNLTDEASISQSSTQNKNLEHRAKRKIERNINSKNNLNNLGRNSKEYEEPIYNYLKRQSINSTEKKHTSITLPNNWSGRLMTSEQNQNLYNYGPVHTLNANIKAIIFRSNYPIATVSPTKQASNLKNDDEAMISLASLDQHLKNESGNYFFYKSTLDWLTGSSSFKHKKHGFYRQSKCLISDLNLLTDQVYQSATVEGQSTKLSFYAHLQKIIMVINIMLGHLPKDKFPFEILQLNHKSIYERTTPFGLDFYIEFDHLKLKHLQVSFSLNNTLSALVVVPDKDVSEEVKELCLNQPHGLVLSCKSIFSSFAKCFTNEICKEYETRSLLPDDVRVRFDIVSLNAIRFNIRLLPYDLTYQIELHVALSVPHFPNVFELTEKRKWPDNKSKTEITRQGVHLTTKGCDDIKWNVLLIKTRNFLLRNIDLDFSITKLLLSFQFVNDRCLSKRGCYGMIHPNDFLTLLFWTYESYNSIECWTRINMGLRFLDILFGLKRCLQRKECRDFLLPRNNYFDRLSKTDCKILLQNLDELLDNPVEKMKIENMS